MKRMVAGIKGGGGFCKIGEAIAACAERTKAERVNYIKDSEKYSLVNMFGNRNPKIID